MVSPPVHHIRIRAFCYGTEIPDRVGAALRAVYPELGAPDEPAIEVTSSEGHYGHQIDIFSAELSNADQFRTVIDRIAAGGELTQIARELDQRVTHDNELVIRFDKQTAYREEVLTLGQGIEVSIKLEAYPAKRSAAIENIREYLDSLEDDS